MIAIYKIYRLLLLLATFSKEDYRGNHKVMEDFLELIVRSLDDASRHGVLLRSGERLHPIPIGSKGDWPYLAV